MPLITRPKLSERGAADAEAIPSTRQQREAAPLYASRIKVYPQRVQGFYRRIKWSLLVFCLAVYYLLPWLRFDRGPSAPNQALLIDLPGRRAYFFWIEIWPQEVYYLTGLLILAAIGLFLVTSIMGRVWCGYACPQTVWTDLFLWVERRIEGDRNARIKLDQQPWTLSKLWKKVAKHAIWLAIAAATGGAWVLYFQDAPTAVRNMAHLQASVETWFFFGLFTSTTYLLAGWAREQVCTYMCPWPRIQAAMLDENTLTVTYRDWRGEPRGKHKQGASWEGRGDCVDCRQCVAVCPTGIDIRDGSQLECIGCGLCIDACDSVMTKVGRPARLIAFDTLVNQAAHAAGQPTHYRLFRARTIIYAALLVIVGLVMLGALTFRPTAEVTVQRERNPLFVKLSNGDIRNGYTVKILNKTHSAQSYSLKVKDLPGARLSVVGVTVEEGAQSVELAAASDSVATYHVYVAAPADTLKHASNEIEFDVYDQATREHAEHESVFMGPAQ